MDENGIVLYSSHKHDIAGISLHNYIKVSDHRIVAQAVKESRTKTNPIIVEYSALFGGKYIPRRAEIYHEHKDNNFLFIACDRKEKKNMIEFTPKHTACTYVTDLKGNIINVDKAENTITGNPVGMNVFDTLLPYYKTHVKLAMQKAIETGIAQPMWTRYFVEGRYYIIKGSISAKDDYFLFNTVRTADNAIKDTG